MLAGLFFLLVDIAGRHEQVDIVGRPIGPQARQRAGRRGRHSRECLPSRGRALLGLYKRSSRQGLAVIPHARRFQDSD